MSVAAALGLFGSGCGPAAGTRDKAREASPSDSDLAVIAAAAPMPVVLFHLQIIRDWETPWFIISSEDLDLTLPAAIKMGIPAELWIRFLIEGPQGWRHEIYFVRKLRC